MKKKRIYFYANLGDLSKPSYGGGEEGNRRTLKIFTDSDFDPIIIPKYNRVTGRLKPIVLLSKIIQNYFNYFFKLLFGKRSYSIVHISGFYGIMVYWELLLTLTARILGYKIIYEMRGGGATTFYNTGGIIYKYAFKKIIYYSKCIFSQGKENFTLIQSLSPNKRIFYYPNYIMDDFRPSILPSKPSNCLNLLYFGRLGKTKNIDKIILATQIIKSKISKPITLTLIGNFENSNYKHKLCSLISSIDLTSNIIFLPSCHHNELAKYLLDKHFYIFPTSEPREGHSNALTEAMAFGIVPVASDQGFNKSVINDPSLIIPQITPENIAKCVIKIIHSNHFEKYSKKMYQRIIDNYSFESVSSAFIAEYNEIFQDITNS